jgi:hypothetical protein
MSLTTAGLALTMLWVLAPAVAGGQQKKDSVEARRRATNAQGKFELVRRHNLPLRYSGPRDGTCDARIGRFCQWNDNDDTVEAREPRVIRKARATLLATLDSAAKRSPRDGWITGQRIRYLLEADNDTAAVRVARECKAAEWWCAALEGLALHQQWNGDASDSAFAHALRAMPEADRCRWTDMTPILDYDQRKKFGKVGCGKNEDVAERLWWLADPFWSLPGNDRRSEHYARHTMAKIFEPARNTFNLSWSGDLREMMVRYGWSKSWTRGAGTAFEPNNGPISGHEATPNYHFVPVSMSFDSVPKVSFDLERDASAERYAPVMAKRVFEIEPQIAVFRRGDSALVVAAYDVENRRELDSTRVSAAIVLTHDEHSPLFQDSSSGRKGAMKVLVDSRPQLMSVEVVNLDSRSGAAWMRAGLPIPPGDSGSISMSDPLLFQPQEAEVADLDAAMTTALGSTTVRPGKVGIYWETYGLARSDSAEAVSLTLTRVQQGTLRRIGESIGLAARSNPLTIRWNQMMAVGSVTSRAVVLDLALIPRGKYLLRIDTGPADRQLATTSRVIEIR